MATKFRSLQGIVFILVASGGLADAIRNSICLRGVTIAKPRNVGRKASWSFGIAALLATSGGFAAVEQLEEIIVTAEKRAERASDVPMSITAVTGGQLEKQGITRVDDLAKVAPGFTYQPSDYGTPVYSIRGIGFKSDSVAVAPTVSVYVDQVPLPYSVMTPGAAFDLERVEILKGPQGTLFGENSTGGAINFVAAKPTDHLEAGVGLTYGRFNEADAQGFISGPLTDTLSGRIALRTEQRGDWQTSETRDDTLGKRDFSTGRMLLDWKPRDDLRFEFNANGWIDKSDTQAAQFVEYSPTVPNGYQNLAAALSAYRPAPNDARVADWAPGTSLRRDDHFGQFSLRGDWSITPETKLTSITSWSDLGQVVPIQPDGTPYRNIAFTTSAAIQSFSQELRLAGSAIEERWRWMLGGNYESDTTRDDQLGYQSSASNSGIGPDRWHTFLNDNHQNVDTWASFGSLDFAATSTLTLQSSVRYTKSDNHFSGCLFDTGDGLLAAAFSLLASSPIPAGHCVTLNPTTFAAVPIVDKSLDESNVSWRIGPNWKPIDNLLIYANATKGYKAGSFPTVPGLVPSQFDPIPQESVLAYEAGVKQTLPDARLQFAASVFLYDYRDKQLLGYITTAFGNLPGLVSIPKSRVTGAEITATWKPIARLTINPGVTYVESKVTDDFISNDPFNTHVDLKGESFPDTPRWQVSTDAEYDFLLSDAASAYLGANVAYRTKTSAAFGDARLFTLPSYSLLDLRAGMNINKWRVELWGHNVTNKVYLQSITHITDTVARVTGMPATYGVTVGYKFK